MHFRGVCCLQGRMVDALAEGTDEGRLRLRYASGSRQQGFDPRISEWEPTDRHGVGTGFAGGCRREVKHLSTCRKGYSVSSGERKRMMAKPCACDTRRGLRGCCGIACAGSDTAGRQLQKTMSEVRGTGLNTGPQRVRAPCLNAHGLPIASPGSSTGPVEPRANPPRPLGKPEYSCLTDSERVP